MTDSSSNNELETTPVALHDKNRLMSIALWLSEYDGQLTAAPDFYKEQTTEPALPTETSITMPTLDVNETLKPFDLTDVIHYYITQEFGLNALSESLLDKLTRAVLTRLSEQGIDSLDALEPTA